MRPSSAGGGALTQSGATRAQLAASPRLPHPIITCCTPPRRAQECLAATQRLAAELGAAQEQVVARLAALEAAARDAEPSLGKQPAAAAEQQHQQQQGQGAPQQHAPPGGAPAAALRRLQEELQAMSRRMTSCEVAAGQAAQALAQVGRLRARRVGTG